MFSYLQDVESMFSGSELGQIRKMKEISDTRLKEHIAHFDRVQKEIKSFSQNTAEGEETDNALRALTEKAEKSNRVKVDSVHQPLEKQKAEIVDLITEMNSNMTSFSSNIEKRLEESIMAVGGKEISKKYGFDARGAKNVSEFISDDPLKLNT
jgi:hypothetical protein